MIKDIKYYETELIRREAILKERQKQLQALNAELISLNSLIIPLRDAINLAKKCIEESLKQKTYIEEIVSSGLSEVFGIEHTFILDVVLGDDNTIKGLKPRLKQGDGEFDDPIHSFGAGAQSIASICIRIALLLLSSGTAKILILDEPLANVSPTLQPRVQSFIENTCKETGLQIVMVTHMDQPFGQVYKVSAEGKKKTYSQVKKVDIDE